MVRYDSERRLWALEGKKCALVLGLADLSEPGGESPAGSRESLLLTVWYGSRLPSLQDYPVAALDPGWASFSSPEGLSPETYPAWGGARYGECALKGETAGGIRDLRLYYRDFRVRGEVLEIDLEDPLTGLAVTAEFELFVELDLIRTRSRLTNRGPQAIRLERFFSGLLYPRRDEAYRLTSLQGHWAGETRVRRQELGCGLTVLESRRGFTSQHANPFFALDPRGESREESGEVWFGALAWSGNWKVSLERDAFGMVRVAAGMNDFDFGETAVPGECLESPWFLFGYTDGGFGAMSRALHAWQREFLPRKKVYGTTGAGAPWRPVLYNSWEATAFGVNEADQMRLAEQAARLGVELFVMDDGWFGARNSDRAGLGDWQVNSGKFPRGLGPLIARVRELGMRFGLWVEPEMVNPDSELYRAHPDWVYRFPGRKPTEMRNQLVLNLAMSEVEAWLLETMDRLLTENDISFVKWDLNRSIAEPGTAADFSAGSDRGASADSVPSALGRSVWTAHTRALWRIADTLRERHPGVAFQSCSGGGGRVDMGILERFDQVWPSDNRDALDRLGIQEGFSLAYGAHLMEAWVTGEKNWLTRRSIPLAFRFHAAMAGVLGIGEDIGKWDEGEFAEAAALTARYKELRPLIQGGDLYRLSSRGDTPGGEGLSGRLYVSEDKRRAVLFAYLPRDRQAHHVSALALAGLDPSLTYRVTRDPQGSFPAPGNPWADFAGSAAGCGAGGEWSGAALMARGLATGLRGDWSSAVIEFTAL